MPWCLWPAVLAVPAPSTDLTAIQNELASLQTYVDAVLDIRGSDIEIAPTKLTQDTILEALIKAPTESLLELWVRTKRHNSSLTSEANDENCERKSERT